MLCISIKRIERKARRKARGKKWALGLTYISAIVLLPLCETLIFKFQKELTKVLGGWFWVIVACLVSIHIISGLLSYSFSTADDFYFEYSDLLGEKNKIENELETEKEKRERLEISRTAVYFAFKALTEFLHFCKSQEGNISIDKIRKQVSGVLSVIVKKRSDIFGFRSESKYNMAVYLHDKDDGKLKKFYRVVDNRINVKNRTWKPGFGHIGLCFLRRKAIISPDIKNAPELTEDLWEGDQTDYRSVAASPIFDLGSPDGTREAKGVFIVTSSVPGQLTKAKHESLLLTLSLVLSLFFYHADQYKSGGDKYVG